MTRLLMAASVIALCLPAGSRAEGIAEGNWRFSQNLGVAESPLALLKVEKKDDKLSLSVLESAIKTGVNVSDLKVVGKTVTLNVEIGRIKYAFEGAIDGKEPKVIRGSFGDGTRLFRGSLNAQEGEKIERPAPPKAPDELAQVQRLTAAANQARLKARQSKDANDKAELLDAAKAAEKEVDEKVPGLYREIIAKHPESPFAVDAANNLLRRADKIKPTAQEVAGCVKIVQSDAAKYGPKIERDSSLQVAETIVGQKAIAATALPLAEAVVAGVKESDPLAVQSRALKVLVTAEKAAGKNNAATELRLAKVETALDAEYVKKVPPFKPENFAGRKDKDANRVAVMELFTGATCPPCVAADAAFDALKMSYQPKDLILIQYHMHIPAPDTLTNPDTIARWNYYSDKFKAEMRGVPSALFNGKPFSEYDKDPTHGGGGAMSNSENKFGQYRNVIDPLLEAKSDLKISGTAKRAGDKINIGVKVDGVAEPGDHLKCRLLLVEEKVRYAGSNGIRFHHQVVRAMPAGGSAGTSLVAKTTQVGNNFDLTDLRTNLTKYLDDFAVERAFPNPDRPMELSHLKVIALVQDDNSGEILNAAEIEVEGK